MSNHFFRAVILCGAGIVMMGCADNTRHASGPPNPQPLADLHDRQEDRQKMEVFTGTLEGGVMAIGGETTGWRLIGDGEAGALMVDIAGVEDQAEKLSGQRVAITGQVITREYVERGKVPVLVARRIQLAE